MIQFKLNSQPYQPTDKSKHFQKRNSLQNSFQNEFEKKEKREMKMMKITTVYCSSYLKMMKEYNTDLPDGCTKEQLDYIQLTQEQSHSLNQFNNTNGNNNGMKRNNNQKKYSLPNHAHFTSHKKSDQIEILTPTTKPIAVHHPSLLSSSSNNDEIESIISEKRRQSREKQIFFGKNTSEYQNYIAIIPKEERRRTDPKTPDIEASLSKRKWDRIVRRWRRSLHAFDDVNQQNQVELARALALRLQNEHNPKKTMLIYSSLPYSSSLIDE